MDREIPGKYGALRKLYKGCRLGQYGQPDFVEHRLRASLEDAEVVTSDIGLEIHCPVLDMDVLTYLVPSTTPGHSHLYIDHPMKWRDYKRLLKALARAGILEKGYAKASIRRKHSAVRVPWVRKEQ